jgi:anti-sigma regulatory factor (Ser/Thr protein kinase)
VIQVIAEKEIGRLHYTQLSSLFVPSEDYDAIFPVIRELSVVSPIRRFIINAICEHSTLTRGELAGLELAVGEAVANACRYGEGRSFHVRIRVTAVSILVEIDNTGRAFEVKHKDMTTDLLAEHGRGFALMRELVDSMDVSCEDGHVVQRLVKKAA